MPHSNTPPTDDTTFNASSDASADMLADMLADTFADGMHPVRIANLLITLGAIPRFILPEGWARQWLTIQIKEGWVDNLYTPIGNPDHWLIAWNGVPRDRDPRQTLADWIELCQFCDPTSPPSPVQEQSLEEYRAEVAPVLEAIRAIPRDELPDGLDRNALMRLAEMQFVASVYRPHGTTYHTIWWRRMVSGVPARERVSDWLAARRDMERQP